MNLALRKRWGKGSSRSVAGRCHHFPALRGLVFSGVLLVLLGASSANGQTVTRGPYLQLGTASSVTIRWRTDVATNSRVSYGDAPGNLLTQVDDAAVTTEHVVLVSTLAADTTYYYSVGTMTAELAGNDATHFFLTAPATGTARPTRAWVLGDSGTADASSASVRDAYFGFTGARHTDLWLMLGDNAYEDGNDAEFQAALFDTYPSMLRKSVLWPTYGNHDARSADSATQMGVYYDIHTLPATAQAGGVASGTEAYYSFDYGNVHFISLDSFESDRSLGSPMLMWLEDDLMATTQDWIIAFWHHPPYSKGSHDSDLEDPLREMRENAVPVLEAGGVDLVLSGHSHSYERSFLIDGHYGLSDSLVPGTMILDGGDGRSGGDGAYAKSTLGPGANEGAVYLVAGNAGKLDTGPLNHPAIFISIEALGSVVLDFQQNRLDVTHLLATGGVHDTFTIVKSPGAAPVAPTGLVISDADTSAVLDWADSPEGDVLGYRVHRSTTTGGPYTRIDGGPDDVFLPLGSSFRYDDSGADLGTAWREPGFDDSLWASGPAELGYGDGDEATTLGFGGDPNNKFTTYYFRADFQVADPALYSSLDLSLKRDDGAVVYLNGVEILRSNMPTGPITFTTFSSMGVGSNTGENTFNDFALSAMHLVAGQNVLAVEIHQNDLDSSDIGLDLQLSGQLAPLVLDSQYTDVTAVPGTEYFYVVTAVNTADVESADSSEACTILGAPGQPSGLVATPGDSRVDLDWSDGPECDVLGYNVYRSLSPGVPLTTPINLSPVSSSDYADLGLTPDTTYHYVVTVIDLDGHESIASAEVSATATGVDMDPPVISSVQVINITDGSATVTWTTDELADSLVDFGIDDTYGMSVSDAVLTQSHSLDLEDLAPNTPYHYSVTSVDASTNSSSTTDAMFTTLPPNQAPTADDQDLATDEDVALPITLTGSDPEGAPLTYAVLTPPSNGNLSGTPPALTYTPNLEYSGPDSFTFQVNDGQLDSNTGTISIAVAVIDDPPVANPQSVSTDQDVALPIVLTATDAEGQALTYSIVDSPASGVLSGTPPSVTYEPNAGFSGVDSFTFLANDGTTDSNVATVDITVMSTLPAAMFYLATTGGTLGSVTAANEDIVGFNGSDFVMVFDGSDVGLGALTLDAFDIVSPTELLMSFNEAASIPGIADVVADSDIVRFTATELGDNTSGTFELYFDGSDVGMSSGGEDVDAIELLDDGTLLVSGSGSVSVPGVSASDEDILAFTATSLGATTSGSWVRYFDGSDVGLGDAGEDMDGLAIDFSGNILFSTAGSLSVTGLSAADEDIASFQPSTLGDSSSGTFDPTLFFDGSANGLGSQDIIALDVLRGPPNASPQADPDGYAVTEDDVLTVLAATGVLFNDSDPEGDPITAILATDVGNGTLSLAGDGSFTYTPDADFSGADSFTYTANDGTSNSSAALVTITVNGENDPPQAFDQGVAAVTAVPEPITLVASDPEGDPLTYTVLVGPSNGSLTGVEPNLTYTSNPGYDGPDSLTFQVNDGFLDSNIATVTITVTDVPPPPPVVAYFAFNGGTVGSVSVANEDIVSYDGVDFTMVFDGSDVGLGGLAIDAFDVISGNEILMSFSAPGSVSGIAGTVDDSDIVRFTATTLGDSTAGVFELYFDGSDVGLTSGGEDIDALKLLDNGDLLFSALGSVSVSGASGADEDFFLFTPTSLGETTAGSWALHFDGSDVGLGQSGEDTDGVAIDSDGALILSTRGSFTVTGASGADEDAVRFVPTALGTTTSGTFDSTLFFDGSALGVGGNDINGLDVPTAPLNQAPQALPDGYGVLEDGSLVEPAGTGVLQNDSDADGDPLTASLVTDVSDGTLSLAGDGSFTYTPDADFAGVDQFTYVANDGTNDSAAATVTLTVTGENDDPVASDQGVETSEDVALGITLVATDVDEDALTYTVSDPSNGVLTGTAPTLTYTPNAEYSGADSFTFFVNDGTVDSNVATVSITVTAVNDPPEADPQSVSTDEDVPLPITLTGSDVEGSALTFSLGTGPSQGIVTGTPPNVTYTPNADFNGPDSFTFTANDGTEDGDPATISIMVDAQNDPPTADPQLVNTIENVAVGVTLTGGDVDGDLLTFNVLSNPAKGVLSGTPPDLTYTPNGGENGSDSFTFESHDGTVASLAATVSIDIQEVSDPPTADDQSVSTDEDVALPITLTGSDPEDDPLTYMVLTQPTNGSLTGTAPDLTYTPAQDYNGPDGFTFKVNDGQSDSDPATISITVESQQDPPEADDQLVETDEDVAVGVTLTGSDPDGDPLTYMVLTQPSNGSLTGTAPNLTYTPTPEYDGPDSFTFKVNDGSADSNTATVSITVGAQNDPPVADDQPVGTDEDVAVGITLTGSDPDGDPLTYMVLTQPSNGTLSGTAPNLTYTPAGNYNGPDSFTFNVNDGLVDSNTATVSITVAEQNDPPVADDQPVVTDEDVGVGITLTGSDPDGDPITFVVLTQPSSGMLTGAEPNLVYTPDPAFSGPDSFTFTTNDGLVDGNTAAVSITVNPASSVVAYFVFNTGTAGGLSVADEDIVAFDGVDFTTHFDGSDVGLGSLKLDGFDHISSTEILMSFAAAGTVPGISGTVEDSDIVRFTASQLGDSTSGVFDLYFDGSDVGLTGGGEDVDAIQLLSDGRLLVSVVGSFSVTGLSGPDEDLLLFDPTSLGEATAGTWSRYFDGSDVGLGDAGEDVTGVALEANGDILLTTSGTFSASGQTGADEDVFRFIPTTLGATTSGSISGTLFFDGSAFGLGGNEVQGMDLP